MTPPFHLSIHNLPESGWAINSQPVYGPGSVFQGFVRVEYTGDDGGTTFQEIDRLRILFYASETLVGARSEPQRPIYEREQFFGSHRVLWQRKENDEVYIDGQNRVYDFHFAIELPMVQFPPSRVIPGFYSTKFCLVASLERSDRSIIASSDETPMAYMPLIESRPTKQGEMATCQQNQGLSLNRRICYDNITPTVAVRFVSLNYVAGDQIQIKLSPVGGDGHLSFLMALTQNIVTHDGRRKTILVAESRSSPLDLPRDLLPSVSYSKLISVHYKLKVIVSYTPGPTPESSSSVLRLSRLLRSKPTVTFDDIPIHIGTLGYGLKAPTDLKPYSAYQCVFNKKSSANSDLPPLPVPHFVTTDADKDALPPYESYHLPVYEECLSAQSC